MADRATEVVSVRQECSWSAFDLNQEWSQKMNKRVSVRIQTGISLAALMGCGLNPLQGATELTQSESGIALHQFMTLSNDRTHLVNTFTNQPVFITGDTAYNLITQLTSDAEVETYLSDRQAKGINLIWVALVDDSSHGAGTHPPGRSPGEGNTQNDAFGNSPWNGGPDFTGMQGATAYWDHVDNVLQRAAAHGITVLAGVAFAATFASCNLPYYSSMKQASDATMRAYGAFLGGRYKSFPNIIWLQGGDANVKLCGNDLLKKTDDIARGILSEDPAHLMAVEATSGVWGETSATYWSPYTFGPNNPNGWLTLGTIYPKGTPENVFSAEIAQVVSQGKTESNATPFVPFFSIEDPYEYQPWSTDAYDDQQLRQVGYTEILSGATLGRLFGSAGVWPFGAGCCQHGPRWQVAMERQASFDQQRLGQLFRSREYWKLVPDFDHTVVTAGFGAGEFLTVASRTSDGETVLAYIPNGKDTTLTVNMASITSGVHQATCWWFNPSSGTSSLIGIFSTFGKRNFTPPDERDWLLVIDDAAANLRAPGSA